MEHPFSGTNLSGQLTLKALQKLFAYLDKTGSVQQIKKTIEQVSDTLNPTFSSVKSNKEHSEMNFFCPAIR